VAAGLYHSLFIKSDGSLWAMGRNYAGQLGDNTTTDQHTPEQIVFDGVTAVAAGEGHSLYLKSDGSLWGMGATDAGQLGTGDYTNRYVPVLIVPGPPPPQPLMTGINLSGTNLILSGANGVSGEILYTLTSTDLTQPLSQWQSVATNVLSANGSFTITAVNAVTPGAPQQFYILQAQ
jgi:hypothetical protein